MTVDTFQFAVSSSPRRIEHPEQFNIEIPHDVTTLAGRACDSAGAIDALESGHPFAADVGNILATWARAEWASERFMGEVAKQDWNIGYDFLPRTCRDVNLPSFVGYLWFQPGWDLILGDGFQLMGGTKYLFLNFLGRSKYGCVYIAKDTGDEDNPGPVSDPSLGEEGGDDATSESEEESDGEDDAEDDSEDGTATDDDSSSSTGDSNPSLSLPNSPQRAMILRAMILRAMIPKAKILRAMILMATIPKMTTEILTAPSTLITGLPWGKTTSRPVSPPMPLSTSQTALKSLCVISASDMPFMKRQGRRQTSTFSRIGSTTGRMSLSACARRAATL